jgi:hypothetical protein
MPDALAGQLGFLPPVEIRQVTDTRGSSEGALATKLATCGKLWTSFQ